MNDTAKDRIAYLAEKGEDIITYKLLVKEVFDKYDFDFFETPDELRANINKGYKLFILGMMCGHQHRAGLILTNEIRENKKTKNIPILISSTIADLERPKAEIEAMGVPSITKPYFIDELKKVVKSLIE
ncbi:MAG: hypothetical protein GTN39_05355 [Candidatus Aenigmarchaeota archaeon]|nr:hypothetical protein [Candidatus Aenigmarchaeota archaeon]